jgi:hypothetical protein
LQRKSEERNETKGQTIALRLGNLLLKVETYTYLHMYVVQHTHNIYACRKRWWFVHMYVF